MNTPLPWLGELLLITFVFDTPLPWLGKLLLLTVDFYTPLPWLGKLLLNMGLTAPLPWLGDDLKDEYDLKICIEAVCVQTSRRWSVALQKRPNLLSPNCVSVFSLFPILLVNIASLLFIIFIFVQQSKQYYKHTLRDIIKDHSSILLHLAPS